MARLTRKQLQDQIIWMRSVLDSIEADGIEALRRDATAPLGPDGFAASARGDGSRSADTTSSVERAALSRRQTDHLAQSVKSGLAALEAAQHSLMIVNGLFWYGANLGKGEVGRVSQVVDCVNCGKPALPRPISGRCADCAMFRKRHDGVDRRVTVTPDEVETREAS